ncbi:ABC transporter [Streptomyces sp. 7R007]
MARALLLPVARSLPRGRPAAGAGLGLLLAGVARMHGADGLALLRGAAVCFAAGAAFLLDDPARRTTEAVPTGRPLRTGLRVTLLVPAAALWWTAAVLLVPAPARPPVGAVTLEAAALTGCALALATAAVRCTERERPGGSVLVRLLTLTAAVMLVPERWGLFVGADSPRWGAAHGWWAAVLGGGLVVAVVCVREPLRRRWAHLGPVRG